MFPFCAQQQTKAWSFQCLDTSSPIEKTFLQYFSLLFAAGECF